MALTRKDTFEQMARESAEEDAMEAARRWFSQWNPLGPSEDSVHRELYDAMKKVIRG